jgi:hypothetical protein
MMATFLKKNSLYNQLEPLAPQKRKNHLGIKALPICNEPTYLKNLKQKTLILTLFLGMFFTVPIHYSEAMVLRFNSCQFLCRFQQKGPTQVRVTRTPTLCFYPANRMPSQHWLFVNRRLCRPKQTSAWQLPQWRLKQDIFVKIFL